MDGTELTFLGTASGRQSRSRSTSASLFNWHGQTLMIDAGEGTSKQLLEMTTQLGNLRGILITHMHGDHVLGLPSVLLHFNFNMKQQRHMHFSRAKPGRAAMRMAPRRESLGSETREIHVYGPAGLFNFIETTFALIRAHLSTEIFVHEFSVEPSDRTGLAIAQEIQIAKFRNPKIHRRVIYPDEDGCFSLLNLKVPNPRENISLAVRAAPLRHTIPCVGYVIEESDTMGRIDKAKCVARGLHPGSRYSELKNGRSVVTDSGETIKSEEVLYGGFRGRKLALVGDTCQPSDAFRRLAMNSDLIVHEATLDASDEDRCDKFGHSSARMAACFARRVNASKLILTHFSQKTDHASRRRTDSVVLLGGGHGWNHLANVRKTPEEYHFDQVVTTSELLAAVKVLGEGHAICANDFLTVQIPRGGVPGHNLRPLHFPEHLRADGPEDRNLSEEAEKPADEGQEGAGEEKKVGAGGLRK